MERSGRRVAPAARPRVASVPVWINFPVWITSSAVIHTGDG